MIVESPGPHSPAYGVVVYNPPAPGLPWLAIRLGPHGKVLGVEPFDTWEAADRHVTKIADDFAWPQPSPASDNDAP